MLHGVILPFLRLRPLDVQTGTEMVSDTAHYTHSRSGVVIELKKYMTVSIPMDGGGIRRMKH